MKKKSVYIFFFLYFPVAGNNRKKILYCDQGSRAAGLCRDTRPRHGQLSHDTARVDTGCAGGGAGVR